MTAREALSVALRKLVSEMAWDAGAIERVAADVAAFDARLSAGEDPAIAAAVALRVEHFYTAVEATLHRIAKVVDGEAAQGAAWHQQLLKEMALGIEGVRPAVIGAETQAALRPLLGFRHFLRHAYAVSLEARKLHGRAKEVAVAWPLLSSDLAAFSAFLRATVGELDTDPT